MLMDGWDMGGDGWLGSLLVLILVAVVVFLISREVTLRRLTHRPTTLPPPGASVAPPAARPEPLDILRERFARGDMTVDEFVTAKRALGYPDGPMPPPAAPGATPTG
jgi:uncharacterized membrane protein